MDVKKSTDDERHAAGDLLRTLAAELRRVEGIEVRVITPACGTPYLRAVRALGTGPCAYAFAETIRCDAGPVEGDGQWFFWSWGAPLCPADRAEEAAAAIGRVLAAGVQA